MYGTFNMGIGMVLAVDKNEADKIMEYLISAGEKPVKIGNMVKREGGLKICHN